LFIGLLGFGDDSGKVIPAWFAFATGGFAIFYGLYLRYKIDDKIFKITKDWKFNWKNISSDVYLTLGILCMRMNRLVDAVDKNVKLHLLFAFIGLALICYGIQLFLKEKKEKKESGNLEQ